MPGFDLRKALRRAFGDGEVPTKEAIEEALTAFDGDGDGALTVEELARAFFDRRVGGKWLTDTVARGAWDIAEQRERDTLETIPIPTVAWAVHDAASHPLRPERRYPIRQESILNIDVEEMQAQIAKEDARRAEPRTNASPGPRRGAPRRGPRPRPRARPRGRGRPR